MAAGTLGSLDDLLAARRVLEPLLERAAGAERDDCGEETDCAVACGTGGESPALAVALWELVGEPSARAR